MSDQRSEHFGVRLFLEGIVILVSILAAFFLEGWRDERELARELGQELTSVGRELERNRTLVAAEIDAVRRVMTGAELLLESMTVSEDADHVVVRDSVAWLGSLWSPTLDPSLGALDALIASGRLARIENQRLRVALAGLRDIFEDVAQEDRLAQRITLDQLLPLIQGSEALLALRRITTDFILPGQRVGATPQEAVTGSAVPSYGLIEFPNSSAMRSALSMKLVFYTSATGELQALLAHLDELMALVSAEV